jgi:hypothetical protein
MDRLTFRDSKGEVWIKDAAHVDEQGQICMLADRLAEYEDTGLTPEEIKSLLDRLQKTEAVVESAKDTCEELWGHGLIAIEALQKALDDLEGVTGDSE